MEHKQIFTLRVRIDRVEGSEGREIRSGYLTGYLTDAQIGEVRLNLLAAKPQRGSPVCLIPKSIVVSKTATGFVELETCGAFDLPG